MESLPTGLTGTTVGGGRFKRPEPDVVSADGDALLAAAQDAITEPGAYLVFQDTGAIRTVPMAGDSMRIGRSLSADLRFADRGAAIAAAGSAARLAE